MFDLLVRGGYTMLPLFVCSVLSLAVIIEKLILVRRGKVMPKNLVDCIKKCADIGELASKARDFPSPFSKIVEVIIKNRTLPKEENKENTEIEAKIHISSMERGLLVLEIVAAISPLLGLLGTVLGLVDVFNVVAKVGVGQTSAFSGGIAKALITTVAGLLIAIPSLIAYRYFSDRISSIVLRMEKEAAELINRIYGF